MREGKCGKRGWAIGECGWENVENGDGQSGNVVGEMWETGLGNRNVVGKLRGTWGDNVVGKGYHSKKFEGGVV